MCIHTFNNTHLHYFHYKLVSVICNCNLKLEVLRQHRPLPNASSSRIRIVIWNGLPDPDSDADRHQNVMISWSLGHTPALRKISSKSVGNSIIQWIRISNFGLLDPNGDPDRHQNGKIELIGPWAMPYSSKKFCQNPFTTFSVIRRTDKQSDRQTNKQTNRPKWKHNLLWQR